MRIISFTSTPGGPITLPGTSGGPYMLGVGGVPSRVYGVRLVYGSGAPATTVFTITNQNRPVFTSPASNTSTYYPILEAAYGTTGTVLSTGNPYVECVVAGDISVSIASAAAGAGYDVVFFLLDDG